VKQNVFSGGARLKNDEASLARLAFFAHDVDLNYRGNPISSAGIRAAHSTGTSV